MYLSMFNIQACYTTSVIVSKVIVPFQLKCFFSINMLYLYKKKILYACFSNTYRLNHSKNRIVRWHTIQSINQSNLVFRLESVECLTYFLSSRSHLFYYNIILFPPGQKKGTLLQYLTYTVFIID
jgi:hypothetical protein